MTTADKTMKTVWPESFKIIIMVKNPFRDGKISCFFLRKMLINDANNLHLKMELRREKRDKINSSNTLIFIALIYFGLEIWAACEKAQTQKTLLLSSMKKCCAKE